MKKVTIDIQRQSERIAAQQSQHILIGTNAAVSMTGPEENQCVTGDLVDFGPPNMSYYGSENGDFHPGVNDRENHEGTFSVRTTSSRRSILRQRTRTLELEKEQELHRIQSEADSKRLALELANLEREEQRRIKMTMMKTATQKENLRDELEEDEDVRSLNFQPAKEKVKDWLENDAGLITSSATARVQNQPKSQIDDLVDGLGKIIAAAAAGTTAQNKPIEDISMKTLMSRFTIGKSLPDFFGRPETWPTFIRQFRGTTELCHISDDENMLRLDKHLKGDAKLKVTAMMYTPNNLELVISTLERLYGRPEHILEILITKAKETASPKDSDLESLIAFSTAVMNLAMTMESLNRPHHLHNPQLLKELMMKLPSNLRLKWGKLVSKSSNSDFSIQDFAVWLDSLAKAASFVSTPRSWKTDDHQPNNNNNHSKKPHRDMVFTAVNKGGEIRKEAFCTFCEVKGHIIFKCDKFRNIDVDKRWEWVSKDKVCFCCLRKGHRIAECKSTKTCEKEGCNKQHNTLLHKDQVKFSSSNEPMLHTYGPAKLRKKILLRIAPVILKGPKGELKTFALFDEGATVTMLDSSVAKKLGLKGQPDPLSLQWTHGVVHEEADSSIVNLEIAAENGETFHKISNTRTMTNMNLPIQTVDFKKMAATWGHLKNVQLGSMMEAQPMILLGQDNTDLTVAREVIEGPRNSPMLSRSKLGWVVHGNAAMIKGRVDKEFTFHITKKDEDLHNLVKDYWTTDTFGVKVIHDRPRSKEDVQAQFIFDQTTRRVGARWETGLIWRHPDVKLPESKNMALKRLYQLEKKLDSDKVLAEQYYTKMDEYMLKGYSRVLPPHEVAHSGDRLWYLPHFAATHPNKPGKIRLVFDAAAKSHGTSLNDALFTGPDLLNLLVGVLSRFRQYQYAFAGDLQEMFHQIPIRKEDLDSQRFLWRGRDRTKTPDVMEIPVMTFGSACSPFSAQSVKNLNARQHKVQYPDAVEDIVRNHYMDDYLKSVIDEETGSRRIQEILSIHKSGGFNMRGITSNSAVILNSVQEDLRAEKNKTVNDQGFAVEKVLGLRWLTETDTFGFTVNLRRTKPELLDGSQIPTKREILRLVMSVFDPLGFVAHLTIKAHILLQKIWKTGIGWDDPIPLTLAEKWNFWISELKRLPEVEVPRCYSTLIPEADSIQLHVFCDGSEQAFSAVAFIRYQKGEHVEVGFVMSKARVSPVRQLSIPRLELQAAVLGSRLSVCIKEEHEIKFDKTYLWSDSSTVLKWLRTENRTFKTFVAHRIGEIDELTDIPSWHWIPTKLNVADDATRDNIPTDLNPSGRWFAGPEFLKSPPCDWPKEEKMPNPENAEEEMKKEFIFVITPVVPVIEFGRFSKYTTVVRVVGWVRRFLANYLQKQGITGPLSIDELHAAEVHILKESQRLSFPDELRLLDLNRPVDTSSRIRQLSPFVDEGGLIRIDGRIKNADVDYDTIHPIILDPKNKLTKLLIQSYHERANHQGQEFVLNEIRQTFWILNARSAIRSCWFSCQLCKNNRVTPDVPEMGVLPEVRVRGFVRPFTHTGVDYFGPMEVTVGRRREKRYGVLFTCLTTRGVHLELASSLTSDSCVMAIHRMVARRGCPDSLYSDNGSNFRGAEKEIRTSIKNLDQDHMTTEMTKKGIRWNFNPPGAPHMGGAWERLVRSVKTSLKATLKEQAPKEEVLLTLMMEAESIVNSRPLTHVPVDPLDSESLTPNHFLIGTSSAAQPWGKFSKDYICLKKKWKIAQHLADHFWKRWTKEYLPSLVKREKWHRKVEPVKVGDVIILADPDHHRNTWPRGIITATFPGKDGQVRVAYVKTAMGIFRRPVSKICVLDVFRNGDERGNITVGDDVHDSDSTTT